MNYIFACVIVALCWAGGFVVAGEYLSVHKFYKELVGFVTFLKRNINYNRELLKDNFVNFSCSKKFKEFLLVAYDYVCGSAIKEDLFKLIPNKLDGDSKNDIVDFLQGLGKNDNQSQQDFLSQYTELFSEKENNANQLKTKNYNVSIKLGIGIGLVLAIIII